MITATSIWILLRCPCYFTQSTKNSSCFVKLFHMQSWRHRRVFTLSKWRHPSKQIHKPIKQSALGATLQWLQSACRVSVRPVVHCDLWQRISEPDLFQKAHFASNTTHEPLTCVDFQIHGSPLWNVCLLSSPAPGDISSVMLGGLPRNREACGWKCEIL